MRYHAIVLAFALAACGQQPPKPVETPNSEKSETPVAAPSSSKGEDAAAAAPAITLTANSIILVGAVEGRGTATTLEFGRDRKTVLDVMAFDFPAPKLSNLSECGAGPMEFAAYGPLKLNFLDGKLVGWFAEKGDNVVTSDGIRPGVTIGELKGERSVKMLDSTLEGEFEYGTPDGGTIGGFAEGKGDSATITSLHAGTNCFFR